MARQLLLKSAMRHLEDIQGDVQMKIETMKTLQSLPQEILSLLSRVAFGLFLGLTGLFSVPCYAGGLDDEEYGLSQTPGKVFGGIVVHLQKMASTGDDRILIDLTPMTSKGVPVCQKPSGKLVSVLAGKKLPPSQGAQLLRRHSRSLRPPSPPSCRRGLPHRRWQ